MSHNWKVLPSTSLFCTICASLEPYQISFVWHSMYTSRKCSIHEMFGGFRIPRCIMVFLHSLMMKINIIGTCQKSSVQYSHTSARLRISSSSGCTSAAPDISSSSSGGGGFIPAPLGGSLPPPDKQRVGSFSLLSFFPFVNHGVLLFTRDWNDRCRFWTDLLKFEGLGLELAVTCRDSDKYSSSAWPNAYIAIDLPLEGYLSTASDYLLVVTIEKEYA